ncbi:brefeldin A-inhibited guanine nucleotide-exchange protein 3-like [Pecten maximus]|uniref:brefeldin A-inhibited guanine nucleotide-exchange protein 3-like n=1 Tax=Pecten maximus TaxID=6579 RepID=UPI0014587BAE|nr:brefeldin A-inhibited guanine nucleotide-exchange protein 3-like [Pecten maximus]
MLLSAGESFTENMWQISSTAMQRALDVTTFHLRQLMILFEVNSENFYGDRGQVKVAMRRDSSSAECKRLQHLAHQVFLLDSQVSGDTALTSEVDEDKSFVFLLYPPGQENSLNPDDIIARIPFRGVVVGLLSHQLLLQTVGSVLLNPAHHPQANSSERPDQKGEKAVDDAVTKLGMVPMMSTRNILTLLKCLWCSNKLAGEFDSRPGLKFLIQKVARTEVAVNLYKQAGASMIFYMNTLLQICACFNDLSRPEIRTCLFGPDVDKLDIGQALSTHLSDKTEMSSNKIMFIQLLWCVCNDLCQMYVDMLSDEYIEKADQMAERELFFLIAQPDSITDIVHSKDRQKAALDTEAVIQLQGVMATEAITLQEEPATQGFEDVINITEEICESPQQEIKGMMGKSKRELREEHDSRVYTLATDTLIKTLMTEYKKRKQHHAMPAFVKLTKQKKSNTPQLKKEVVDEVIEKQQKTSLMKDSEARAQSLTELLCTILGLFQQLSDQKFDALLPAIYNCANQLVCHAQDPRLKEALGQWTHRIGAILQLMPSSP